MATLFFVLLGCGSTLTWHPVYGPPDFVRISFAFGLGIACLVQVSESSPTARDNIQ